MIVYSPKFDIDVQQTKTRAFYVVASNRLVGLRTT